MMVRPMQTRPVIFVVAVVLLVPFVYGISSIPDVCAAAQNPGYTQSLECTGSDETGKSLLD